MNLHRADIAEWETVPPDQRNAWQRMASRTRGVVAPANLISLLGAIVTLYGVYLVAVNSAFWGITAIILGRLADILDGVTAEATKTKSPFGEAMDATVDKIVAFAAVAALAIDGFVPWIVALGLLFMACLTSAETLYYKRMRRAVHPSQLGKLTAFAIWTTVPLYVFIEYNRSSLNHVVYIFLSVLAAIAYVLAMAGSIISLKGYIDQARDEKL